jgi:hypothetical protein
MVKSTTIAIIFGLACGLSLRTFAVSGPDNAGHMERERTDLSVGYSADQTSVTIESITLQTRNWESHGTDIAIYQDGTYRVTAAFLGETKTIREGKLPSEQLQRLAELVEDAGLFVLPNEYAAPFKTEWRWWGYELAVTTRRGAKTIRFHSEDDSVPPALRRLVDQVMQATK